MIYSAPRCLFTTAEPSTQQRTLCRQCFLDPETESLAASRVFNSLLRRLTLLRTAKNQLTHRHRCHVWPVTSSAVPNHIMLIGSGEAGGSSSPRWNPDRGGQSQAPPLSDDNVTTGDDCVSVPLAGTLDELISRFDSLKGNIVAGERGSEGRGETFCHATECKNLMGMPLANKVLVLLKWRPDKGNRIPSVVTMQSTPWADRWSFVFKSLNPSEV